MKTLEERLMQVNGIADKREEEKEKSLASALQTRFALEGRLLQLHDRIKDLCTIADECIKRGIDVGQNSGFTKSGRSYFFTNGIKHSLGFYPQVDGSRTRLLGVGMSGGGCCCWNVFYVDRNSARVVCDAHEHTFQRTRETAIKNECDLFSSFLKGFDDFELRFYNYLDSLK